ncbi:ABC-2 transporter permease [Lysinibacillus sp. NPDC097287]|uniref:ABC-2 transporter permease n=1 Tax=Lysinibacillus sp. NPDC097287 TaxID=3364144 RepID=UPI0038036FCF
MTALFIKDLLIAQHKLKQQIILFLFIVFIVAFIHQGALLLPFIALMAIIHVIATLAYDEQCNWGQFANTLPLTKSSIVCSKYLLGITLMLGGLIITMPLAFFITHFSDFVIITDVYLTLRIVVTIGFCFLAIMLPIYIQFGSFFGRIIMLTFSFLAMLLVNFFEGHIGGLLLQLIEMKNFSYVAPIIGLILLAFSYVVAVIIYKRKEF